MKLIIIFAIVCEKISWNSSHELEQRGEEVEDGLIVFFYVALCFRQSKPKVQCAETKRFIHIEV